MLTGTDEHGQKMMRAAAANGVTPQEWVDRLVSEAWFPLLKTLDVANDDFIRTTQPRHEERVQQFVQAIYDRGYIYAGEFEALYCVGCEEFKTESEIVDGTGPVRGPQGLRDPLEAARAAAGEELLLQAERVPGQAARAVRGHRLHPARVGAQRGRLVRQERAEGPVDLALDLRLGHHRAVGRVARHLRVGRRAAELRHGGRLRRGPRGVRAPLAGVPRGRQGHPALPRRHLARDADGGRRRGAARRLRARLAARRRREDVEVEAHRHRADRDHRRVRLGRVPVLLPLGDRVRPGRLVLVGGPLGALPGRARQRLRQPRLAHAPR